MESCDRFREAISARLDGEATGISETTLDAHLRACADCRSWADAAGWLAGVAVNSDVPPLRPHVMAEMLDQAAPTARRRRSVDDWRAALVAVALVQLIVAWPGVVLHRGGVATHAAHELTSLDLGLAAGLLLLAWLPGRAWGALPVVAVMVAFLAGASVTDLLVGQAELTREAVHTLQIAGLACLWMIARRLPPSSPRTGLSSI